MKRVVVLHSGGLDSTTCLLLAKRDGNDVLSLGIDYGQRHSIENKFAVAQCERFGIERQEISVNWSKPRRAMPLDRSTEEIGNHVSSAFLPGRNVVFFSIGLAHAAGLGAREVWTGINAIDFSGYPDCTPEFFAAYSKMYAIASPSGVEIKAPLLKMPKSQIAKLAASLGICRYDTWSCYRPQIVNGSVSICERCDACKLHELAWNELNNQ